MGDRSSPEDCAWLGFDRDRRVIPTPDQMHRLAELMPPRPAATVYVAAGPGLRLGGKRRARDASTFSRTWTTGPDEGRSTATLGLPRPAAHYATLLIHAGASVKAVQLVLGHSTPTITLNEYVHE
jgi:hypothetical protein